MSCKMYAIFARETLVKFKGNEGLLAAQAGHAYLHAYWDAEDRWVKSRRFQAYDSLDNYYNTVWIYREGKQGATKVCLVVDTVLMLRILYNKYKPICGVALNEETKGHGVLLTHTITSLGIGPLDDENKCEMLANLSLLRHEL